VAEHSVVLADFAPLPQQRPVKQEQLLSYQAWLMASARCAAAGVASAVEAERILEETQALMQRYAVAPHFIERRQFNLLPDSDTGLGGDGAPPRLPIGFEEIATRPAGPTLDERMQRFAALALEVFRRFYERKRKAPDDLIHVTCSGYASPSPAQRILAERGWYATSVLHSYHMGCYGAFPAIRSAVALLAPSVLALPEQKSRVDLVHTEFLSNHVAPLKHEPGDFVDMTLFADGFIGYSAFPEERFRATHAPGTGLRVLASHEELIPDSAGAMTWTLGPHQFDMYLSKDVPLLIRDRILPFTSRLCARAGLDFERVKRELVFAIHPGGPKILDHSRDALGIGEQQIAHSRRVFRELGNMSSASVPHILMAIIGDDAVVPGTRIVSMGFGPGLTATGLLFEKC
jgi:alkylresorcinol/alkylpyrone synthase